MTAAILRFNQHIRQTHTNNSQASNNQSDYIDTPLTREYHQIMIDLLNTEHPFRAVRLAEIFNRENGFELIDAGIIRKWKKEIMKNGFSKKENPQIKIRRLKSDFSGIEVGNIQDSEIKKLEIKIQLETGYRELLGG